MKRFISIFLVLDITCLTIFAAAIWIYRPNCPECECPDYTAELAQLAQLEEADLILEFFWAWYHCERGMDKGECIAWMSRVLREMENEVVLTAFDNYLICATCSEEEKEALWQEFGRLAFDMLGCHVEGETKD